jgi:sulfur relay (sulfurtransferase) complex TusBCD TusD component (DsrE family)
MEPILVLLAIAGMVTGAIAQSGPITLNMTCAQARGIVASQGAGGCTQDRRPTIVTFGAQASAHSEKQCTLPG